MVDLYLPKQRHLPFREIPPQFKGDIPTIVMDMGTLDGHQFEELECKVKEDAQDRLKKQAGRIRPPIRVTITRLINKYTRQIIGYRVETKKREE